MLETMVELETSQQSAETSQELKAIILEEAVEAVRKPDAGEVEDQDLDWLQDSPSGRVQSPTELE